MKYQKALSALHEYIANFDPDEFSSPPDFTPGKRLSPEQKAEIQTLKTRLQRKRLLTESLHALLDRTVLDQTEEIITQEEIDALLEGWRGPE
jgi:hypothetical protein